MSTDRLSLTKLRELDLEAPSQPGRPAHVSAASGLVRVGPMLYVIADDELQLGIFRLDTTTPGRLMQLGARVLDLDPKARKRAKPDFEALVHVRRRSNDARDGLLALGSGSTEHRLFASWIELDAQGAPAGRPLSIDLRCLYSAVARAVGEVNIEGAIVRDDELLLFQRGNKGRGVNAVIAFDWRGIVDAIASGELSVEPTLRFARNYDLGSIADAPLTFTDATLLSNDMIVFTAVAEETSDAYADGPCAGAAVGLIGRDGELLRVSAISEAAKIEGVHAELHDSTIRLLLVSDADDPIVAASLFAAELVL